MPLLIVIARRNDESNLVAMQGKLSHDTMSAVMLRHSKHKRKGPAIIQNHNIKDFSFITKIFLYICSEHKPPHIFQLKVSVRSLVPVPADGRTLEKSSYY